MQKYRVDVERDPDPNGAVPCYAEWIGGPTLSVVRKCPVGWNSGGATVTAYITGDADTWSSIPAVCRYLGKRVRGYVTSNDDGLVFHQVYY